MTFGGLIGGLAAMGPGAPDEGRTPFFEFARSLGSAPVKTTYLRDHASAWYHRGVRGVGPDVDSVADRLRELVAGADVDDVVLLGNSAGGYGALLFGALLGWDAYVFSPQTFIDPDLLAEHGDIRWSLFIDALGDDMDPRYADLRPVLERSTGRSHVYFPSRLRVDAAHAERLRDVPQVTLHPIEYGGHALVRALRDAGWLQPFVAALVTGDPVPEPPARVEMVRRTRAGAAAPEEGVETDLEPDSPAVLVTFGGGGGGVGALPAELSQYATVAPLKTIRLRDPLRTWYHQGVAGIGPDVDSVAEWLGDATSGVDRVVTAGNGAGGYAALLFGALVGAEVHAISPRTLVAEHDDLDERYVDLLPVMAHSKGTFDIYYATNSDEESAHAAHVAELPNVRLHGLLDPGQGVLKSLMRVRWTRAFARALAAGEDVPSPAEALRARRR